MKLENKKLYLMILSIAIPSMLQQLVIASVNMVDNLMVGQLGDIAIGAVASANRFYFIALFGLYGILGANSIFVSQYHGARNEEKMKETFRFTLILVLAFFSLISLAALIFPQQIISYFVKELEIIKQGVAYLRVACLSFLPLAISLTIASSMKAIGEAKVPLYISIVAVLINTFLNYIFIFGNFGFKAYGVEGAGFATVVARVCELFIYLIILKRSNYEFKTDFLKMFVISKDLIRVFIKKAAPLVTNELLWSFGQSTLFKFYATRGSEAISGFSISSNVGDIFFVLFAGMSVATTVIVSKELGANNLKKAKENAYGILKFALFCSIVFGMFMYLSSYFAIDFYNVSLAAKQIAKYRLRIDGLFYIVMMCTAQIYFILRAGGDTVSTLIVDSVYSWFIVIPLMAYLAYFTDVSVVWLFLISQVCNVFKLLISFYLLRREKWLVNLTI